MGCSVGVLGRGVAVAAARAAVLQSVAKERGTCGKCGLNHAPGELFVITEVRGPHQLVVVNTCELEAAWSAAHAQPQPSGSVAYHATRHPEYVLEQGLDPASANGNCKHICLAETAEIAAGVGVGDVVVEIDVSGLDLFFELGEARHHDTVLVPERIRLLEYDPAPIPTGWSDPGWRRNHSDCIARRGLPLSRRLLNTADEEYRRRWPYDAFDDDRFRGVVAELAAEAVQDEGPSGEPNAAALPTTRPRPGD